MKRATSRRNGANVSSSVRTSATTERLRRRVVQRVDSLSRDRLRQADDFLKYLEERESAEATDELLAIPGFMKRLRQAEAEARKGKLTDWRDLRRTCFPRSGLDAGEEDRPVF